MAGLAAFAGDPSIQGAGKAIETITVTNSKSMYDGSFSSSNVSFEGDCMTQNPSFERNIHEAAISALTFRVITLMCLAITFREMHSSKR